MDDERVVDAEQSGSRIPRARRNTRPRDALGRPMPYGSAGVDEVPSGIRRTPRESLVLAQELLDAGRPFHAHEVLEDAWKSGPATERALWRGLAQLAVGITHAARGNATGAARLIERGVANIAPYAGHAPHGVDVGAVVEWSRSALAQVARESPVVVSSPPLGEEQKRS